MPRGDILLYRAHLEGAELLAEHFIGLPIKDVPYIRPSVRGLMWHPRPDFAVEAIKAYHDQGGDPDVMTVVVQPFTQDEILRGVRERYVSPDALELLPEPEVTVTLKLSDAKALYDCASVGVDAGPTDSPVQEKRLSKGFYAAQALADACRKAHEDRDTGRA